MKITARLQNSRHQHEISLQTNDQTQAIHIPSKANGFGSGVNGGELLFLALATCYCNDIYREATKIGLQVTNVTVSVTGEFGQVGEPARNISYSAQVSAEAAENVILALMRHTDTVAEIQNTLRLAIPVTLDEMIAIDSTPTA